MPCSWKKMILSLLCLKMIFPLLLPVIVVVAVAEAQETNGAGTDAATTPPSNNNFTTRNGIITLLDGNTIPVVGLGVSLIDTLENETYKAVQTALSYGYRLVDTANEAETYGNEDQVGAAIRDWQQQSQQQQQQQEQPPHPLYITTKLWDDSHGFFETLEAFEDSFQALFPDSTTDTTSSDSSSASKEKSIDMYLIHSPFGGHLVETWDAMIYLQEKGFVKSIGVSNFGIPHLEALLAHHRPLPTINQIELHPLNYQQRLPLIKFCQRHNIQIQAYGSLFHGYDYSKWFSSSSAGDNEEDVLTTIHKRLNNNASPNNNNNDTTEVTKAQILLRWALQHNFLIIPKSSKSYRIYENIQLYHFTLSEQDMDLLDHWGDNTSGKGDKDKDKEEEESNSNDEDEDSNDDPRNIYKKDWNWNPIDEAPVHFGNTQRYWPTKFQGIDEIYNDGDGGDYDYDEDDDEEEDQSDSNEEEEDDDEEDEDETEHNDYGEGEDEDSSDEDNQQDEVEQEL